MLSRAMRSNHRRPTGSSASVEFVVSLAIFLTLGIFPMIDLMGAALSAAMICMLTHQIATRTSQQPTYQDALTAMANESLRMRGTGFANFLHLQPNGGWSHSGCHLYIVATKLAGNATTVYGPDQPLNSAPDPSSNVYEYSVTTDFTYTPLIPMSGIFFINKVPGLGQAVQITWSAARAVENVQGLAAIANGKNAGAVGFPDLLALQGPSPPSFYIGGPEPPSGWLHPGVYGALPSRPIIAMNVFVVPANSPGWVDSSLAANPGNAVYIDSHADGLWRGSGASMPYTQLYDANGITPPNAYSGDPTLPVPFREFRLFAYQKFVVGPGPNWGALIGYVDNNPPSVVSDNSTTNPYPGGVFKPAYQLPKPGFLDLRDNSYTTVTTNGEVWAVFNDDYRTPAPSSIGNSGAQIVRMIIQG